MINLDIFFLSYSHYRLLFLFAAIVEGCFYLAFYILYISPSYFVTRLIEIDKKQVIFVY